jgi:hypothetical protein
MRIEGCSWVPSENADLLYAQVGPYELLLPRAWHSLRVEPHDLGGWYASAVVTAGISFSCQIIQVVFDRQGVIGLLANHFRPSSPREKAPVIVSSSHDAEPCETTLADVWFMGRKGWVVLKRGDQSGRFYQEWYAAVFQGGTLLFGFALDAEVPGILEKFEEYWDATRRMALTAIEVALLKADGVDDRGGHAR